MFKICILIYDKVCISIFLRLAAKIIGPVEN